MTRSSDVQFSQRINRAWTLLRKGSSRTEVAAFLIRRYRTSPRQAYRYIREAEQTKRELPIPEPKVVFTVKLPGSLVRRIRELARSTKQSISTMVSQVLATFLKRGTHG